MSYWIWFHVALVSLLAVEFLIGRRARDIHRKAILAIVLWVAASAALALAVWHLLGSASAVQYVAGYAIEEALSIDNLFIFLLLFSSFHIPEKAQPRVLFWGVAGAVVLRGSLIFAGIGLLEHFHWVDYIFGAVLLFAAVRLLKPGHGGETSGPPPWLAWVQRFSPVSERTDVFIDRRTGRRIVTVLLLALVAVELTDVVFALDSIPAVLSITREPFLAYTSNIMAVMGLRSLYVLLTAMLAKLRFLHFGLAALLGFAALKMLISDWVEIGALLSLGIIAAILAITVAASLAMAKPTPAASA